MKATRVLAVGTFSILVACATPDTGGKIDYQKLVGQWEWAYPIGYDTLTIETVTPTGETVYAFGVYAISNENTTIRGRHVKGEVDLKRERNEIVFTGFGRLELRWNGGGRLWGSCMFRTWSGDCEYNKK